MALGTDKQSNEALQAQEAAERQRFASERPELFAALTKRNQEFMNKFMHEITSLGYDGDLDRKENELLHTLVEEQKKGVTAKQLYGTPTAYAHQLHGNPDESADGEGAKSPFWQYWVEGGLLIGGVFAGISGLTLLLGSNGSDAASGPAGILTLLLNFVVGGAAMAILTTNQPDMSKPKQERGTMRYILISVAVLLVWIGLISVTEFLPATMNPELPIFGYLALAILALAARWWFKREYKVTKTLF
ncbi:DUF1129 family protein [Aerococcus agrisoli]|uniref:DUF1129 family protein n=1 Tax=Aerococcus agrisoli TaxID=2487350 RepID=A0A3N4GCT8_9LACT|nr:DUF1129 family protein [Aerococcus agrisoli]RPA60619.1 DUF1129 family protein [Aerococcus agrisoli]